MQDNIDGTNIYTVLLQIHVPSVLGNSEGEISQGNIGVWFNLHSISEATLNWVLESSFPQLSNTTIYRWSRPSVTGLFYWFTFTLGRHSSSLSQLPQPLTLCGGLWVSLERVAHKSCQVVRFKKCFQGKRVQGQAELNVGLRQWWPEHSSDLME